MSVKRTILLLAVFGLLVGAGGVAFLARRGVHEVAPQERAALAMLPDPQPAADDSPWWRGLDHNGIAAGAAPPTDWADSGNLLWSAAVPGRGHAAPCLWGERIFLATADEGSQVQSLVCLDRATGLQTWNTEIHRGGFPENHAKNSHASATPACDGQHVFVACGVKGAVWVTAVDMQGKLAWQTQAGLYKSQHGYSSSPVLYKSLVIVAGDNRGSRLDRLGGTSFLAAIHRQTGEVVWRVKRQNGDSFSSPVVGKIAGKDQLVLAGKKCVTAYEPATGRQIWTCQWPAERAAGTVTFDATCVYASATHEQSELICIRADGSGDVTGTHIVWRGSKGAADVPSPLVYDGRLYVVGDQGILTCFDAKTGKTLSKRRLGGNFTASPVLAGGRLIAVNEEGVVFVVQAGADCELIGKSDLGDSVFATPALCGGLAYVRTSKTLRCIGNRKRGPMATQPAAAAIK